MLSPERKFVARLSRAMIVYLTVFGLVLVAGCAPVTNANIQGNCTMPQADAEALYGKGAFCDSSGRWVPAGKTKSNNISPTNPVIYPTSPSGYTRVFLPGGSGKACLDIEGWDNTVGVSPVECMEKTNCSNVVQVGVPFGTDNPAGGQPVGMGGHSGLDFAYPDASGGLILSLDNCVVTHTGTYKGIGETVVCQTVDGWQYAYGHTEEGSFIVGVGQCVEKGDPLAYIGTTGFMVEPKQKHTHLEVKKDGILVDPAGVLGIKLLSPACR